MVGIEDRIGRIAIKWVGAGKLGGFVGEYPELMEVLGRQVCSLPRAGPATPVRNLRELCRIIDTQEMEARSPC